MIRNIIFDIGNVLADFRWREFLRDKGFDRDMTERIARASVLSPYWNEVDRGVLGREEVMARFVSVDPGIEEELHVAYDNINAQELCSSLGAGTEGEGLRRLLPF